ncbi:MAG: hypothetical protein LKE64_01710 [Solobacterium sp.]|jgi:hypothetical protein|nr:hypothetical protein [Solobacterium sp.]MCH4049844.1 hypothetical protein [Solobacterium sp.]MCH4073529.1 hypothetical protein [Solobacterium sp.]MCI1314293.1 hypothetical protein [Solobacterium sp.]MCI1346460.1 hypothetical protein [Solobacterium sp.]
MLKRTEREDTEGYFRWHWVLTEFLAIYCEITDQRCFGVKKALKLLVNMKVASKVYIVDLPA